MIPDLTISIVNHSNPELLQKLLDSIFETAGQLILDVVVVDNATDQRLVPEMKRQFPSVKWIFNPRKMGFSANHNQVMKIASSRHVCILNDDTVIYPGAMTTLVQVLDENANAAMVGPRLVGDNDGQQDSAFRELNLHFFLGHLFPIPGKVPSPRKRWVHPAQFGDKPEDVDWLLGACIVARCEALKTIGLLDEQMSPIANGEDVDWCIRAKRMGWRVIYVPAARVYHYGGMTLGKVTPGVNRMRVELWKTSIRYLRKNEGLLSSLALRALLVASLPWNSTIAILRHMKHRNLQRRLIDELATLGATAAAALFDWSYPQRSGT